MGPGFDTLGVALSLRNEVDIKRSKFFSVSIKGEGKNNSRMKSGNIFVSIFNEQYKNITGKKESFRFEFSNNIPISRGLGSSSATIVTAVKAAECDWAVSPTARQLSLPAVKYHSTH